MWQRCIDLKGGREGRRAPWFSYLSPPLCGWKSQLKSAYRQGSHDSTREWLLIEWETKISSTCSAPPHTHTHRLCSSSPIRLISSELFLLPAYKSPPEHKATYSCLGPMRTGGGGGGGGAGLVGLAKNRQSGVVLPWAGP